MAATNTARVREGCGAEDGAAPGLAGVLAGGGGWILTRMTAAMSRRKCARPANGGNEVRSASPLGHSDKSLSTTIHVCRVLIIGVPDSNAVMACHMKVDDQPLMLLL